MTGTPSPRTPSGDNQTYRNATLTVVQVLVSAAFLFGIYKYILFTQGATRLGVWSIVMALSTLARITDLGFAGGMTRFIAKYRAQNDLQAMQQVVGTGAISLALIVGLLMVGAFPVARMVLPRLMDPQVLDDAYTLLPFSMASFALLAVGGVFLSSLDGIQRADLRNILLICGTLLYGLLIVVFVELFGFAGLGFAQIGQSVFVLIGAWVLVRKKFQMPRLFPVGWRWSRFKEMLAYNANLQFATLASFLGDPATKLLLGHYGSLAMVGYYEMASKMVAQFRAIMVNVNQVLVPVITHLNETQQAEVQTLYKKTYLLVFGVSATFYAAVLACVPVISHIWLGNYNDYFLGTAWLMLAAMQINTLTGAAFFSNMGTGQVGVNSMAQVLIGLVNLGFGSLLGYLAGGAGVIAAYAFAIVAGSLFLLLNFQRREGLGWADLFPPEIRSHVAAAWTIGLASAAAAHQLKLHEPAWQLIPAALAIMLILISAVKTPSLRNLLQRKRQELPAR